MSVCVWLWRFQQVSFVWAGIIFMLVACVLPQLAYAGEVTGSVELGVQEASTSSSGSEEINTVSKTQRYNLDYAAYLFRPWLADYRIGGTFSQTEMDKATQESTTTLSSYRFNGKLFPYSPFPLSMYVIENETDVTIQSNPDSTIDTRLYGADLKLDFYTLPTTNLFYYGQTTRSNLATVMSEQDSNTAGINMFKRWGGLTANLRYENSDYMEHYSDQAAQADRLTSSWVYRPSETLQTSFVYTDYQRESAGEAADALDPLYSDRANKSHNFSVLWNPQQKLNMSVHANYFLEDYELNRREAKDGRVNMDYRLTDHLSAFVSGYELRTDLNGEEYNSQDRRSGMAYSRAALFGNLELQGRLSGGYFTRTIESIDEIKKQQGEFYQTGVRAELNIQAGSMMVSPYYDINYGYNQQTNVYATTSKQQDTGLRIDGVIWGGRMNGSISNTVLEQENDLTVRSEQFRSYLSYEHRLLQRATVRVQAGTSTTKGHVESNTFDTFTQTEDTDIRTSHGRVDFATPVFGSNVLCNSSYRREKRTTHDGAEEENKLFDIRFTHQFGKLHSEAGVMKKESITKDIESRDSIWFVKIRRDFSFGSK